LLKHRPILPFPFPHSTLSANALVHKHACVRSPRLPLHTCMHA
jgi:hypothetical protein